MKQSAYHDKCAAKFADGGLVSKVKRALGMKTDAQKEVEKGTREEPKKEVSKIEAVRRVQNAVRRTNNALEAAEEGVKPE